MDRVRKINRRQCMLAFISAVVVVVCVCIGVTMNLTTTADENFDHMGLRTFCMFTVNSNILCAAAMAMVIPYTLDGLRTHNYHMPRWIVDVVYMGVTAVALTFLISLLVLSPVKGFVLIFTGSRFFLHGVCPILSIVTFCCFICSHLVRPKEMLLALVPVLLYAAVYLVMVVFIGEEHGGWNDFYGFATRIPLWVSLAAIVPVTLGLAALLRLGHNRCCLRRRAKDAALYRAAYTGADLRQVVEGMARSRRAEIKTKNIVVPAQLIGYMVQNTASEEDPAELCRHYLEVILEEA